MNKTIDLPEAFLQRMKESLGASYQDYLKSFENPSPKAIRLNRLKLTDQDRVDPVPWTQDGEYVPEDFMPSDDPAYFQGLYYPQDASAMLPAELLETKPGDKVLDLCAAPGGKSGKILSDLKGEGFLLANEVNGKRAKILSSNIERMGAENAVIVRMEAESLANLFPETFDKIVVDAPCSGEGMFRKEEAAIRQWNEKMPASMAEIQKHLINQAVTMLKPGGVLVYSTCTFSPEEDESLYTYILDMEDIEAYPFEIKGIPGDKGRADIRLYPHEVRGEGQYALRVKKKERTLPSQGSRKTKKKRSASWRSLNRREQELLSASLNKMGLTLNPRELIMNGESLYKLPDAFDEGVLDSLSVLRVGLEVGVLRKGRFEPSHALALSLDQDSCSSVDLTEDDFWAYLRGEELPAPSDLPDGWILICYQQYPVGWGKKSGGRIKNKLPKGLRVLKKQGR